MRVALCIVIRCCKYTIVPCVLCRKWTSVYGSYFGAVEEVLADVRLAIAGVSVDERIRRGTLSPVRRCVRSALARFSHRPPETFL